MMQVTFDDLRRETRTNIGNVIEVVQSYGAKKGRAVKVWRCVLADGTCREYPMAHYQIYRIEV